MTRSSFSIQSLLNDDPLPSPTSSSAGTPTPPPAIPPVSSTETQPHTPPPSSVKVVTVRKPPLQKHSRTKRTPNTYSTKRRGAIKEDKVLMIGKINADNNNNNKRQRSNTNINHNHNDTISHIDKRSKNNDAVRRFRERSKQRVIELKQAYEKNEQRIKQLTNLSIKLQDELDGKIKNPKDLLDSSLLNIESTFSNDNDNGNNPAIHAHKHHQQQRNVKSTIKIDLSTDTRF